MITYQTKISMVTMKKITSIIILLFLLISFKISAQTYVDVTSHYNIHHTFGQDAFGGGVSFYDFDQDGWDDISLATQVGDSVVFYKNTGTGFQEVYFEGIHHAGHVKQILWCDYDNDGDQDLYLSGRSYANYIYINDGTFHFSPYLIPPTEPFETGDTYGAAFGDYDLDGDLDLFICNRIGSIPLPNQLFLNNGDGTMTDITSSFIFDTTYQLTFCASWIDYNNDLLPDLYTAEDRFFVNKIYTNLGNGILADDCDGCGAEIIIDAMSVCPGDYDNDGDLDIYISNTEAGNVLLQNQGDGTFTDVAMASGVAYNRVGWGATFFDYDHDLDLDLYVSGSTNGTTMANKLYENLDLTNFSEANAGFIGDSTRSFSHAIGDINNDGYYDIVVLNIDPDSSQLWQSSGGENNWLKVDLEGTVSNRDGIGTWIEAWSDGLSQVKYTTCGVGYLAQNSSSEIFGFGSFDQVDSIIVKWTSGIIDKFFDVPVNQVLSIVEGSTTSTTVHDIEGIQVSIFPNPASKYIVISFDESPGEDMSYQICDMNGTRVRVLGQLNHRDLNTSIGIGDLPAGQYILTILSPKKQYAATIIKID